MKIIATFVAIIAIVAGVFYIKHSRADITTFTITPTAGGTNDVAGEDAKYDVTYTSDSTGTVSQITLKFPMGYTITSAAHSPIPFQPTQDVKSCNGTTGFICINGVDASVSDITPDNGAKTESFMIDTPFDYSSTPGDDTISFTILYGITNATRAGVANDPHSLPIGDLGFSIDDDAIGNTPISTDSTVTLVAGPADHFTFTQSPDGPATGIDPVTSGVTFDTQPVVEAHDVYDNLADTYGGDVALLLRTGSGAIASNAGGHPTSCPGVTTGSLIVTAAGGIADFSPLMTAYYASVDHESFSLTAQDGCSYASGIPSPGVSVSTTADVVADSLVFPLILQVVFPEQYARHKVLSKREGLALTLPALPVIMSLMLTMPGM